MPDTELRMYLIVRDDLEIASEQKLIPTGKMMGQAGHAFSTTLLNAFKKSPEVVEKYYIDNQTKIVVKCKNLDALLRCELECKELNLNYFLVEDAGRTVFSEPTKTCMAIGPCLKGDLPKYIQKLQLY